MSGTTLMFAPWTSFAPTEGGAVAPGARGADLEYRHEKLRRGVISLARDLEEAIASGYGLVPSSEVVTVLARLIKGTAASGECRASSEVSNPSSPIEER